MSASFKLFYETATSIERAKAYREWAESHPHDSPMLSDEAKIISIDRIESPYNPNDPNYIEKGLTWEQMENLF